MISLLSNYNPKHIKELLLLLICNVFTLSSKKKYTVIN